MKYWCYPQIPCQQYACLHMAEVQQACREGIVS